MLRHLGAAVLVLIPLTACGAESAPQAVPQHSTPAPSSPFTDTDIAWLQLMIPMDQQMLRVLDLAAKHATTPALRQLTGKLAGSYRKELAELVALRTRSGTSASNLHAGHDMPGMMTGAELAELLETRGSALDTAVRRELADHLKQTLRLARSVRAAGGEPGVLAAAAAVERSRTTLLRQL